MQRKLSRPIILAASLVVLVATILAITFKGDSKTALVDLCLNAARNRTAYKDPLSLRVESSRISTTDDPKVMVLEVNAKNSYGAYSGAKSVFCVFSEDRKAVLDVADDNSDLESMTRITKVLEALRAKGGEFKYVDKGPGQ